MFILPSLPINDLQPDAEDEEEERNRERKPEMEE
jgi:hypothetical protein